MSTLRINTGGLNVCYAHKHISFLIKKTEENQPESIKKERKK